MKKLAYLPILFCLMFISCQPAPEGDELVFNQEQWNTKEGEDYIYRASMAKDVLYNDTIRSLPKSKILTLLGEPDRINKNHHYYTLHENRLGFWVLSHKALVIKYSNSTTVEWIKLYG